MPRHEAIAEALCCCSGATQSFTGLFEAVHWTRQQARALANASGIQALNEDSHADGLTVIGEIRDERGHLLDLRPLVDLRVF